MDWCWMPQWFNRAGPFRTGGKLDYTVVSDLLCPVIVCFTYTSWNYAYDNLIVICNTVTMPHYEHRPTSVLTSTSHLHWHLIVGIQAPTGSHKPTEWAQIRTQNNHWKQEAQPGFIPHIPRFLHVIPHVCVNFPSRSFSAIKIDGVPISLHFRLPLGHVDTYTEP